jgi:hypothetical protein
MTARTALTPIQLVRDTGNALGAGTTPDAANGNTIPAPGPFKMKLLVHNGDSAAHTVTVRATGNGVTASGAAQVSPAPSNTVFVQSTLGDLVVSVAAGAYTEIGPLTSDRFEQSDGSLSIDYSASTSVLVWAIQEPIVIPS